MPTLKIFAWNPVPGTQNEGKTHKNLWVPQPMPDFGGRLRTGLPEIRRGVGRGSGNLGNIPEAVVYVSLWRAQQFWNLRFLVVVEATVGKRQGRLYWPGRVL